MKRAQLSTARDMERPQLIAARYQKHLTLREVADFLGVDKATVQRWEKKGGVPQPYHLRQLCDFYKATAQELGFPALDVDVQVVEAEEDEGDEALLAFRRQNMSLRLMRIVWNWRDRGARYHELQSQILLELEDNSNMNSDEFMSRRDALRCLALLPIEMSGLSALGAVLKSPQDDILAQCTAGIVACGYLRKGKDLAFADQAISKYIPTLKALVQIAPEPRRKAAAELVAQALLLKSTLSQSVATAHDAVNYAQQAELYSNIAESRLLQVVALRAKAAALRHTDQWGQALRAAEQAKYLLERRPQSTPSQPAEAPVPQFVASYVYAGLATYQAYHGRKEDALLSLKRAHKTFFERPADEEALMWMNHHVGNVLINGGETYSYLGMYKDALDSVKLIETRYAQDTMIPLTCRIDALTNQILAEVNRDDQPRDMQWCIELWMQAIEGAKMLQSNIRFNAAVQAYTAMCAAWPGEKQVKGLRELIVHW